MKTTLAIVLLGIATSAEGASRMATLADEVRLLREQVSKLEDRVRQLESDKTAQRQPPTAAPEPNSAAARPSTTAERPRASGPVTFKGEFRLYFDSLTRPAGGGAPRVSNIRGRYLLHLDFKAAFHPTLSVNGRLSTAP